MSAESMSVKNVNVLSQDLSYNAYLSVLEKWKIDPIVVRAPAQKEVQKCDLVVPLQKDGYALLLRNIPNCYKIEVAVQKFNTVMLYFQPLTTH